MHKKGLVLLLLVLDAGPHSLSFAPRASVPECCQYAIAKEGGRYSLRLVVQGRLPQVCDECSNATFGVVPKTPFNSTVGSQHNHPQPQRGTGTQRGGRRGSIFVRTVSDAGSDAVEGAGALNASEDDSLPLKRKRVSKQTTKATYSANLREALRPLCQADQAAEDPAVQAMVMSQVPIDCVPLLAAANASDSTSSLLSTLTRLGEWLEANFRIDGARQESEVGMHMASAVRDMRGSELSLAAACAALLRGAGVGCRVVSDVSGSISMTQLLADAHKRPKTENPAAWVEVWHAAEAKWIRMDPIRCLVDDACAGIDSDNGLEYGTHDQRSAWRGNVSHVIAADRGLLTDSTRRYCRNWEEVEAMRPSGWEDLMGDMLEEASRRRADAGDEGLDAEQATFRELGAREELPTSVSALRRHPLFVAERLLPSHEMLRQGSIPVAALVIEGKSEALFSRDHVETLRTRDEWRRFLRQVVEGESPVRSVNTKADDRQGGPLSRIARFQRQNVKQLFGHWQTKALETGAAKDGKVPSNDRGYVELLTKRHLPVGCAHVDHPAASLVARALKVDYAPAMVRTIFKNGFDRPLFQGIVVCTEFEDKVVQGCATREKRKPSGGGQAPTPQKLAEKTLADFRRLVLQVLSRFVLKGDSSGALQDQKDNVRAILSQLQGHLGALRDQTPQGTRNASVATMSLQQSLPRQIHSVMLVIKELGADTSRTPGALQALGLASNRLRMALDKQ